MNNQIQKLNEGIPIRRLITHCGVKCIEQIQKNKNNDGYSRFALPTNRDKNKAIKWNDYLTAEEVINHLQK